MLDNRTQNASIGIIGNEDRHGCREQAYKDGAYVALAQRRRLCGTVLLDVALNLRYKPLLLSPLPRRNTCGADK